MTSSVDHVRKLLDVISLKRRDLNKYYTELKTVKYELSILLEKDSKYRSSTNTNMVQFQQNNIDIIDCNTKYQNLVTNYNKTKQILDHLETVIGTYNINNMITNIRLQFEETNSLNLNT